MTPLRRIMAAVAACSLAVAGSVLTLQAASAAAGCQVTYTVSQWPGGFTGNVSISNLGDALTSWTLRWTFTAGQTVTDRWSATITQSGGNVTATNVSYNGDLATNATTSFGFNGTWNSTSNPVPASFTLNGTTCTGSVTNPPTSAPPTSTAPSSPPPGGQVCTPFGTVPMGKYWINNNLWGQSSGSGTQCVWGNSVSGNVNTSWQYTVNANGTFNVAYDGWFHTIANPTFENQPTDELMIWTYRAGGAGPAGTLQGRVTLAGTQWDLYRGVVGSWMSSAKYLTSVHAGTEVFIGSGSLNTTGYSTNVQ